MKCNTVIHLKSLALAPGLFALLLLPAHMSAQSTFGSVRGVATDTTGATIPSTSLVLQSVEENTEKTVTSDDSGAFLFENIKPGLYTLKASHGGFPTVSLTPIRFSRMTRTAFTIAASSSRIL